MSDAAPAPELLVEQRGPVLWLTIQREERRNALSHAVLSLMTQAIDAAQADRALRAIVVTGAGTRLFAPARTCRRPRHS
jgi:enoyl-CoA hydratase/carnithine racemase